MYLQWSNIYTTNNKSVIGWRVGVCDVPLHIHIKRQKDRKIPDINVWTADTNEQSLATRAGKQNLLVDGWVGG